MDFVDSKSADLFPSYYLQRDEEAIRSRRRRRILRVTILLTSFFLLGWVIKHVPHTKQEYLSFFHSHHRHHHSHGHGLHIPSDLTLLDCPDLVPEHAVGETSVHLELPITSENIFLLSRGSYSAGVVYIAQSKDSGDVIDVDINVFYDEEAGKHLDHARVCTVSRPDGGDGIGLVSTPKHRKHYSHAMARFEVRVTLPREASGSSLNLKKFEVDMPEFAQHVGNLSLVKFQEFSVDTASAPIVVDRLVSDRVRIDTSNGPITGHFNTTSSLELITDNGLIDVSVDATNVDSGFPSIINMKTASPITASIALHSVNQTGGSFLTDTQTTTGSLVLDFPIAPVDSSLFLNGRNTLGEVSVQLHETYEGGFSIGTTLGHPGVVYDAQTEKDRRRTVNTVDLERGQMEGAIFRTEDGKKRGSVVLETTQGDAMLTL